MEDCNKDILKLGESDEIIRYSSKSSLKSLASSELQSRYNFVFTLLLNIWLLNVVTGKLRWPEIPISEFLKNSFLFVKINSMQLQLVEWNQVELLIKHSKWMFS